MLSGRASSSESIDSKYTYEHFPVVCSTCRGVGRLTADEAETLVAPIPVGDHRLKPKRTTLKVSVVLFVLLVIGALCLTFLLPRNVEFQLINVVPQNASFENPNSPWITYHVIIDVKNNNFFRISVSNFVGSITFQTYEVGKTSSKKKIYVPIRGHIQVEAMINATYNNDKTAKTMMIECHSSHEHFYPIQEIQYTTALSYMFHSETLSLSDYFYTDCQTLKSTSQNVMVELPD